MTKIPLEECIAYHSDDGDDGVTVWIEFVDLFNACESLTQIMRHIQGKIRWCCKCVEYYLSHLSATDNTERLSTRLRHYWKSVMTTRERIIHMLQLFQLVHPYGGVPEFWCEVFLH